MPESSAPRPVTSAKDAINAMYSGDKRLSNVLAKSAKDIMNATATKESASSKSAASLHHHSGTASTKKPISGHTSASTVFRQASTSRTRAVTSEKPVSRRPVVNPEVRTSLKLAPKKPSVKTAEKAKQPEVKSSAQNQSRAQMQAQAQAAENRAKTTAKSVNAIKSAADIATRSARVSRPAAAPRPTIRPAKGSIQVGGPTHPASGARVFQDVIGPAHRPASPHNPAPGYPHMSAAATPTAYAATPHPAQQTTASAPAPDSLAGAQPTAHFTGKVVKTESKLLKSKAKATPKAPGTPLDSLKHRFRPAPKGYATTDAAAARASRPYKVEDFLNPSHSQPVDFAANPLGQAPSDLSDVPAWAKTVPQSVIDDSSLGVVEDCLAPSPVDPVANPALSATPPDAASGINPLTGAPAAGNFATSTGSTSAPQGSSLPSVAPDNNHYVLGAQSPFFLKSVSVEKRPLSGGSPLPQQIDTSIYAPAATPLSKKNHYAKSSKSSKKAAKSAKNTKSAAAQPQFSQFSQFSPSHDPHAASRPTVIIPSGRRSHAPLVILLMLTVLLGAAVGGLTYLFLFQ